MGKQMWYSHTMEYYSAIKMNELLILTAWVYAEWKNPVLAECTL